MTLGKSLGLFLEDKSERALVEVLRVSPILRESGLAVPDDDFSNFTKTRIYKSQNDP